MEENGETEEIEIQDQIIEKMKKYFESNPPITSHDELDNFLSEIGLLEVWSSDEEKEQVREQIWKCISKYMKDSKIDCEGAIQGFKDLLNQEEETVNTEKGTTQRETILTRLSRMSTKGVGGNQGPANKLALNKYKQRAIDQYDCLDGMSLIQFQRIFVLLKIYLESESVNNKIKFDDLNEIFSKHKFIKIDTNEIWKYLSFCVYEENLKNLENKKEFIINNDIMKEVQDFINQRIINEDIVYDSDNPDIDNDNNSVNSDGKKIIVEEDPLVLISKIIKQAKNIDDSNKALIEIENKIKQLINQEETIMETSESDKNLIYEQLYKIEEYYIKTKNENENNIYKMESLKDNIEKTNEKIKSIKKDYNELLEKYNNNQEINIEEETERLLDENLMLSQEKEKKEQEIEILLEEKKNMRKEYQNFLMQYENVIKEKEGLIKEISELKINNYKLKNDYEKLINDINKMEQEQEQEKKSKKKEKQKGKKDDKNEEKKTMSYEDQIKEIKIIENSNIDDVEKIFRKKNILKDMTNEKLINYILEVEKVNQTLNNERNKKEKTIFELNQNCFDLNNQINKLKQKNIELDEDVKNMQKKIDNLNNEVKNNEVFRPSKAMNSQMRISRLSKLYGEGINAQKFQIAKNPGISTKKKTTKTYKLKDVNINKKYETKAESISMELYGVKEDDNEEDDQEKENKNKNNFKASNQKDFTISNNAGNNNNQMSISTKNNININGNNEMKSIDKKNEISISNNKDINIMSNKEIKSDKGNNMTVSNNNNDINIKGNNNEIKTEEEKNKISISNNNDINIKGNNNNDIKDEEKKNIISISNNNNDISIKGNNNIKAEDEKKERYMSISNNNDLNIMGNNEIEDGKKEIKISIININDFNMEGNNEKDNETNMNSNINMINNNNNINIQGKINDTKEENNNNNNNKDFNLQKNSSNIEISGNNNKIFNNNIIQNEITLEKNNVFNNDISGGDNSNIICEVENINDINLTPGNAFFSEDKNSEEKNNNNTSLFQTQNNNNFFFENENKNKNEINHGTPVSFFEDMPKEKKIVSKTEEKKNEEKQETTEEEFIDNMPNLSEVNLLGNKLDNEMITKSVTDSSVINKNENNIISLKKEEQNKNKINVEINKENSININGESKNSKDINKIEKTEKYTITNNDINENNDILKKESFKQNNTNIDILNINEEKKNNDYKIEKKEREIITKNTFEKKKSVNLEGMDDKMKLVIKESNNNFSIRGSQKITLLPKHLDLFSSIINSNDKNSKAKLEEMRNNNYDYYSLYQEEYVKDRLREENDNCNEFEIYSDQIFLFTDKKHFSKRYMMITPSKLYIIDPKEGLFLKTVKKENFLSFQISNRNTNVLLFEIKNDDNILIQSLRRMDLLIYLRKHFRNEKCFVKLKYDDYFVVTKKGKQHKYHVKDKIFANLSNFDGALKIGYLLKHKSKLIKIGNNFKEKLFALTSIGLLMFDEPTSPPKKLFPIIGSTIEKIDGTRYSRENCFKITFFSGDYRVFATRKKRERDSWLNEFKKIKDEYEAKMKELDTKHKDYTDIMDKSILIPENEENIKDDN